LSFLAWAARLKGVPFVLTSSSGLSVPKMSAPYRRCEAAPGQK